MEEQNHQPVEGKPAPKLIYHYTDQNGLLGILRTKSIWATHVRYLNDLQEIKAGEDAFRQVIRELAASHPNADDDESKIEAALDAIKRCDIYVASFSAANDGDSLSLWRAYGVRGVSFSLGFDLEQLRKIVELPSEPMKSPDGRWLSKVDYCASGTSAFQEAFELTINSIQHHSDIPDELNVDLYLLTRFFPTIKDAGFSDEAEYRIVQVRYPEDGPRGVGKIEFRSGSFSLIPYVQVPLAASPQDPILLNRIVVGPCAHKDEAATAVKLLIESKGLKVKTMGPPDGVEVDSSKIPYRNW